MDVFAALGDPVRRDLLRRLAQGPARVVDLTHHQSISRPGVSRHLRVLGEAGLTEVTDVGRERHYRFEPSGLADVQAFLGELTSGRRTTPFTEADLNGLELEVRRTGRDRAVPEHPQASSDITDSGTDSTEEAG